MEFVPTPLRHRSLWQTSEAHKAMAQTSGSWVCQCWPEVHFLPSWSSRGSAFVIIPPVTQWRWPGHLYTCLSRDFMCETLGRALPELWWTIKGSSKSLGERPLSHWTLPSGFNQHALCFWHFYTCSVWATAATHKCQAGEEPSRWHVWVLDRMPFPDQQRPCTMSNWRHKTFLVTGVQWMTSVLLRPGMKPNCMSWMCTCCQRKFSTTLCRTFMTWSSNLRPW